MTRDGTAEPVSRDKILRRIRGQGNMNFPCSADHEQDWQPCPVDPYSCYMCDHTYIHGSTGYGCQSCSWSAEQGNIFFHLSPFAPEKMVMRDRFGLPVPRQPTHSPQSG